MKLDLNEENILAVAEEFLKKRAEIHSINPSTGGCSRCGATKKEMQFGYYNDECVLDNAELPGIAFPPKKVHNPL